MRTALSFCLTAILDALIVLVCYLSVKPEVILDFLKAAALHRLL